jgi:hypothetical protein
MLMFVWEAFVSRCSMVLCRMLFVAPFSSYALIDISSMTVMLRHATVMLRIRRAL